MTDSHNYSAVDLFSGAGGMSSGFISSGWNVPVSVEKDAWAAETNAFNHLNTEVLVKDIKELSNDYFKSLNYADVVMGGPPCQGFSISASNRRKKDDPRNQLYLEMIRAIAQINPKAVLIENVPEIIKFKLPSGKLLIDDIVELLFNLGFHSWCFIANARWFNVPQNRKRAFIFSFRTKKQLQYFQEKILQYVPQKEDDLFYKGNQKILSLWDAISDLPLVRPRQVDELSIQKYKTEPQNEYQLLLRGNNHSIFNHVPMNHTSRMVERFTFIQENRAKDWQDVEKYAPRERSQPGKISERKFHQNHRLLNPFIPSPTITASFYSSFIHPYQPRNITVREAARLQSFSDGFIFKGKRTTLSKKLLARKGINEDLHLDQFNQVGNAVPPAQAKIFGKVMAEAIKL